MEPLQSIISQIDSLVWGPVMLVLLMGTGLFLSIRTRFLGPRNLFFALKTSLGKEARQSSSGPGDISSFSALTTALAATIGTGNIVGVATAMVSGGPGALVWMWLSALLGMTSKFSECMLAVKYREVNESGEMSGGPMYTMKKAFRHKRLGAVLGWLFALFAVTASFGIGNMTQANSISSSLHDTFGTPAWIPGLILTLLALFILLGGIKSISKVSQIVVPFMAVFYIAAGLLVIFINFRNLPAGLSMIFHMAFSPQAAGGGLCGSITASMTNALRFGVARGVFSNEDGMGSAAISAAAAATDDPVKQGYISMTGTFWDTIVVCTITGLCIASSGCLGQVSQTPDREGTYAVICEQETPSRITMTWDDTTRTYDIRASDTALVLRSQTETLTLTPEDPSPRAETFSGTYKDSGSNKYLFKSDGTFAFCPLLTGAALTIAAFESALGSTGGYLVCIGITFFAFSTLLGWEYHGEKAFEYLFKSTRYNRLYRVLFSLAAYVGATTALELVWGFSDIANALMAVPNLICLLALSGVTAREMKNFQHRKRK